MTQLTPLSQLLEQRIQDTGCTIFTLTPDWTQGRTMFGGLLSALAVQAMRDVGGAGWPLRALQTNFVGPVAEGPVYFRVQVLREGKNVRQVKCMVESAGEVAGIMVGVFGQSRSSELPARSAPVAICEKTLEQAVRLPFIPGMTPNFMQHFQMHWAEGGYPCSGSDTWKTKAYLRLKNDNIDRELCTVMLTDAPPTPTLSRFNRMVMCSSVSWSLELRVSRPLEPASGDWRIDIDTKACGEGYTNEVATLWTPEGEAAAFGTQVVAVYG
ncbi:MAG: thioesterase family protein [Burkholderiales bacterium]|jgi:acyl-CoA thioesterase|nr:thioesterase family protein [Burkholderiales bacterium]